jgi:hypothetical protein
MTEIIQITGNKSEFSNFVSDPIVLKEDSKVCLNKASFSVPVIVSRNIPFPFEGVIPDYTTTFFKVAINGVENDITYQEFYDAYNTLDTLQTVTIDELYDGVFQCFVDNLATFVDSNGDTYDIPSFMEVVAQACNTEFNYYTFNSDNTTEPTNLGQEFFSSSFVVNGKTITQLRNFRKIISFGLVAQYQPEKVTQLTPTAITWLAANVNNFTPAADSIAAVDANPAMAVSPNTFDPNGGYIAVTPTIAAGKSCVGILFMGNGEGQPLNITGVYQPENIDVGIEFSLSGTEPVLQIIDGHQHFQYSHAGGVVEINSPNYVPSNPIYSFDSAVDKFWFLVRKGRAMNGTTEFTTTIIQGPGPTPQDANNKVIYVAKTTLNTSQIEITTLAYSEGAGNVFDNWEYVPKTLDSQVEDDYFGDNTTKDGISSSQSLTLSPVLNPTSNWEDERDFWNKIGVSQDQGNFNIRSEINDAGWNRQIKWDLPKNVSKFYWFGEKFISSILNLSTYPNYISFSRTIASFITNIPREIAVSLMDLPIVPNVGSFIGENSQYDAGNINKVVNYIQTDKEDLELDDNGTIDYVYEAYNLVYRGLRNQQKMPITQIKVKLGYKDFNTNKEQQIPNMSGIVKLELLFD